MRLFSRILSHIARWLFESRDARRLHRYPADASDLIVLKDIPYAANDKSDKAHLLDIYRPADFSAPQPLIINIHGGGLFASYKEVNEPFNCAWAHLGYAVASISYRRIPDTTLVHQIGDVMTALRFIKNHNADYNFDQNRCFLTGDSAGALLGWFVLGIEGSPRMQQAFGWQPSGISFRAAALFSIMLDTQRRDMAAFISDLVWNAADEGKPYLPYILNPATIVGEAQLPPLFLVTSAEDMIGRDSRKLARQLEQTRHNYRLKDYPKGASHRLEHVFSVQYPQRNESRLLHDEINAFFRQQVKL